MHAVWWRPVRSSRKCGVATSAQSPTKRGVAELSTRSASHLCAHEARDAQQLPLGDAACFAERQNALPP